MNNILLLEEDDGYVYCAKAYGASDLTVVKVHVVQGVGFVTTLPFNKPPLSNDLESELVDGGGGGGVPCGKLGELVDGNLGFFDELMALLG